MQVIDCTKTTLFPEQSHDSGPLYRSIRARAGTDDARTRGGTSGSVHPRTAGTTTIGREYRLQLCGPSALARRARHALQRRWLSASRFIRARAGTTRRHPALPRNRSVHSRTHGHDGSLRSGRSRFPTVHPRTRGTSTPPTRSDLPTAAVHPRMRGHWREETAGLRPSWPIRARAGTTQRVQHRDLILVRSIRARAGTTMTPWRRVDHVLRPIRARAGSLGRRHRHRERPAVHPRTRGHDPPPTPGKQSPYRVRRFIRARAGRTQQRVDRRPSNLRVIRARAGKTRPSWSMLSEGTVHPRHARTCAWRCSGVSEATIGPSAHARARPQGVRDSAARERSIRARAGTTKASVRTVGDHTVHPRTRGHDDEGGNDRRLQVRSIRARAGTTPASSRR